MATAIMNRFSIVLLLLGTALSLAPTPGLAQEDATPTVTASPTPLPEGTRFLTIPDDLEGQPGDMVEVPIHIDNADEVTGFLVALYVRNASAGHPVEFIKFETEGTLLEGRSNTWTTISNDQSRDEELGYVVLAGSTASDLLSGEGILVKVLLRIKENAYLQDYPLEFWEDVTALNDGNIPSFKENGSLFIDGPPPPTPTPEITATPTIDQPTDVTPSPSVTPTPTPTPTMGEATNTPRPGNVVPRISVSPGDHLVLLQGEKRELLVVAYDPDRGDMIEVSLSTGAPAELVSTEMFPNYTLAEYDLDTSELGHYYFTVFAYDGSDRAEREILLSVVEDLNEPTITPRPNTPTPTLTPTHTSTPIPTDTPQPTPTFAPTASPSVIPTATQTISPTPTRPKPVYVTDSAETYEDLSGDTDYDYADMRHLTIRWEDVSQGEATDWEVFVRKGLGGMKFLGHTDDAEADRLDWYPDNPLIAEEYQDGPYFNDLYTFRVVRVHEGETRREDIYDQGQPVGLKLAETNSVALHNPEMPRLHSKKVAIYDDITGGDELASQGSEGFDVDTPSRRGIHIAWNFEADPEEVRDYQVEVKVDDGEYALLGQTNDPRIRYFWWTAHDFFATEADYREGPQHEESYQFRVKKIAWNGEVETMESGMLHYYATEDESEIPLPTFTPTPTKTHTPEPAGSPTPTFTVTPTFTPTPIVRPTPRPYSIYPHDEEGKTVTVVLPGMPSGARKLVMNLIPSGKFKMGSPLDERGREVDEGPQHEVTISKNLYIGIYEITQAQWRVVMGNNPAWFDDDFNKPVESVNWFDCQDFVDELNDKIGEGKFRLPTEAEWEYACRAETTSRFSFGDALECEDEGDNFCELMDEYMWWWGNVEWGSQPVGVKEANPWGLYDMHGNVLEWCQDWYGSYPSFAVTDPTGASSGSLRVLRGGKWGGHARNARSARRFAQDPENRFINGGLRIVWQVEK